MKKSNKLVLYTLIFLSIILAGCQSDSEILEDSISRVRVSNTIEPGKVNSDFFATFDDRESLEIFESMISQAVRVEGLVDIRVSDFDLEVTFHDGSKEEYHLWLDSEGFERASLMRVDEQGILYMIPEEITPELINLIFL